MQTLQNPPFCSSTVSMQIIPPLNGPNTVVKYILFVAQWSPADGIFLSYTGRISIACPANLKLFFCPGRNFMAYIML
jgi:hypothetical protein